MRVSVCHCLDCQRRSGSAFAAQARWPDERITVTGEAKAYSNVSDSGNRATFHFCPECGATVTYVIELMPGVTAVPMGAFADPNFPAPSYSVYENRKHPWVEITGDVDHWSPEQVDAGE
ncbi:CENP-V/GFA domain-containing protein [Sphingomonas antarctica]